MGRPSSPSIAAIICAAGLAIATPAAATSDAPASAPNDPGRLEQELERLDDPPAARHPRQDPLARTPGGSFQVGPFTSVQVNVDALGRNIVGDAANEPSIAVSTVDPTRMVVVWRQFDSITSNFRQAGYARSTDAGASWTFPGSLDPGIFHSDPVIDVDADGTFHYASLMVNPYRIAIFRSANAGATWSTFMTNYAGDKEWLAIDRTAGTGRGNLYTTWQPFSSCCGSNAFSKSTDHGVTFRAPVPVARNPYFGTMAVGPDGEVYIAGFDGSIGNGANFAVAKSVNAKDPLASPTFTATPVNLGGRTNGNGPNPGGLNCQTTVVVDHSNGPRRGTAYVVGCVTRTGSNDPMDVVMLRSSDGGTTWTEPVRVNDDIPSDAWQWFAAAAVAPNGRLDVVWFDGRFGDEHHAQLFYSWSYDGGTTWARNLVAGPLFDSWVGWPNQNKIGDYIGIVSNSDGAHVAYAATFNGEQDIYYVRLVPDCNGNGVSDEAETADGSRPDANGNGFPDECELQFECDGAGAVPDGAAAPGQPLAVARGAAEAVELSWGAPSCGGTLDYAVYEGTIGVFTSHTSRVCSTGGARTVALVPLRAASYFLVVPVENGCEGSYGRASSGFERRAAAGACWDQRIVGCP